MLLSPQGSFHGMNTISALGQHENEEQADGCELLQYIPHSQTITVVDVYTFAFMQLMHNVGT